jgi:Mannosyl-glycoprotein endo-beta-N-acetylglucosaminidase/N-acetylmuramoyl-L-alanine amidase
MKRVLVQAGHLPPLQPGIKGLGTDGERELVTKIRDELVGLLLRDGRFEAIPMPGRIPEGIQCDAALFLHADGVDDHTAHGCSFGFDERFPVNKHLADLIFEEFAKLPGHPTRRQDNGTADEHHYYGFRLVDTPGPEALVEHGFLTNPTERQWLVEHIKELAHAEYVGLCRHFGLPPSSSLIPNGGSSVHPEAPLATTEGAIGPATAFLAPPRASRAQLERFVVGRGPTVGDEAAREIIGLYDSTCAAVGLDPLLLVAQMVLETGGLTSFWSQPPRRNLAGIGVTGEPGVGKKFSDWPSAVHAHVGRLLRYAIGEGRETEAQKPLIAEALKVRRLPRELWGIAPAVGNLGRGVWAVDAFYANKVIRLANEARP